LLSWSWTAVNGDADQHAMAVIRHWAPEVADLVLPVSLLASVLDLIAAQRRGWRLLARPWAPKPGPRGMRRAGPPDGRLRG
jgi:hypothetical protein